MGQPHPPWAAVVLSGGRARRLGGSPKHAVRVGGKTLLERTLDAVTAAEEVVVVGEGGIREDPPFSGPAAAIGAGLTRVSARQVTVVACDHPFVADAVDALMADDLAGVDGAIAVDAFGRRQNLLFTAKLTALQSAVAARPSLVDVAVHDLLSGMELREVAVSERSLLDVDTWDDHAKLEEIDAGIE